MTTRKHVFYGILALVSLLGLGVTQAAKANTITTFNVSGTCVSVAPGFTGTTFGGTLTIDVTAGTVNAIDVSFPGPGLSAFNTIILSIPFQTSDWTVLAGNGGLYVVFLNFTTGHTPPRWWASRAALSSEVACKTASPAMAFTASPAAALLRLLVCPMAVRQFLCSAALCSDWLPCGANCAAKVFVAQEQQ